MTYPLSATEKAKVYSATLYPVSGGAKYNVDLNVPANGLSWIIKFTPVTGSTQIADGAMMINNFGQRCWKKTDDATCDLTDPTQAWSSTK
jgi:hypothetical protein